LMHSTHIIAVRNSNHCPQLDGCDSGLLAQK
jgi:hypothetical protein